MDPIAKKNYKGHKAGSPEIINEIVTDHMGWAQAIARSVARSWNLDWQTDGLDGGAYEGLVFCAQRFDPDRGIPFRGYARRRIHESSTEEARRSKKWKQGVSSTDSIEEQQSRENQVKVEERLRAVMKTLRGSLEMMEDDLDDEDSIIKKIGRIG